MNGYSLGMSPGRGILQLSALIATLAWGATRAAAASTPEGANAGSPAEAASAKKKARKPTGTKADKKAEKKKAPKAKAAPETKVTHTKSARLTKQKSPSTINEDVRLTPFPSHPEAAKKALAQNRRDQLDDAEKAARSPEQADRWQTVLFHLRNLDARADSEGCFWRLVAYYRLGQIDRARTLRQSCDFIPKDAALIEAEDEQAAHLQGPTTTVADKEPPSPVGNPEPYAGAAPTRIER